MKLKHGEQQIREEFLWHGTRTTDPDLIIKGEEGFDIKYSSEGMWGRGIYFARDARYSNAQYAYHHGNGQKGMFYARVLLGNVDVR